MRTLLPIIFLATACGYDGSIGEIKKDLAEDPVAEEEATEPAETAEPDTTITTDVPEEEGDQGQVSFVNDCTGPVEGTFDVQTFADKPVELVAWFDNTTCNSAFIRVERDGRNVHITGGQCGNGVDQILFSRRDIRAERIRIVRGEGFLKWYADDIELGWLTIYGSKQENKATICRYDGGGQ